MPGDFDQETASSSSSKNKKAFINASDGMMKGISVSFDKLEVLDAFKARAEAYLTANPAEERTLDQLVVHAVFKRIVTAQQSAWVYDPRTHVAVPDEGATDEFD